MGTKTAIEWTDHTWNPWQGCTKVSEACRNCYMYADKRRYGQDPALVSRSSDATFYGPGRSLTKYPTGSRVFTCSWSDWFHYVADPWRDDAWDVIRWRPDLTFQILTKRPERIRACLPDDWGPGWPHVWLGVTVESDRHVDRLAMLAEIPAAVRFASCEPLLGHVDLPASEVDWVICGGESGPGARPMAPASARRLRDQCAARGIPFFFKQWGDWLPYEQLGSPPLIESQAGDSVDIHTLPEGLDMGGVPVGRWCFDLTDPPEIDAVWWRRIGKKRAGRLLDGTIHDAFPLETK